MSEVSLNILPALKFMDNIAVQKFAVKYILFDLDGTITESSKGIVNSVQYALDRLGFPNEPIEKLKLFIGPPLHHTFRDHYVGDNHAEAVALYREYYAETGIFENELYEGIIDVLEDLKSRNKKISLATSKPTFYAEKILSHFKIDHYFDAVIGSHMNGDRTDKKEIIRDALSALNCEDKTSAIMIGDRHHDINGANHHELTSIGVEYGYAKKGELKEANASFIINSPLEILNVI